MLRRRWLSLDSGDTDPVTFWTYAVEALERAAPGMVGSARTTLAGGPAAVDVALTTLLNALAGLGDDVVLVLDDFHVIESTAVHQAGEGTGRRLRWRHLWLDMIKTARRVVSRGTPTAAGPSNGAGGGPGR
jgi:hypothetical protein